jgi:hypothetical protein
MRVSVVMPIERSLLLILLHLSLLVGVVILLLHDCVLLHLGHTILLLAVLGHKLLLLGH